MGWEEEKAVRGMLLGRLKEEAEAVARERQATTTTTATTTTGPQEKLSHRLLRVVNDDDDDGNYMAAAGSPSRRVSDDKQSCGDADDDSQMADSITLITITKGSHPSSSPSTHSVPLVWLAQMMGCQQTLTTKRVWLSLVKCSATECECDKV